MWSDGDVTANSNIYTVEEDVANIGASLAVAASEVMSLHIVVVPVCSVLLECLDEVSPRKDVLQVDGAADGEGIWKVSTRVLSKYSAVKNYVVIGFKDNITRSNEVVNREMGVSLSTFHRKKD